VRKRIAAFADKHGLPEERFYNLGLRGIEWVILGLKA